MKKLILVIMLIAVAAYAIDNKVTSRGGSVVLDSDVSTKINQSGSTKFLLNGNGIGVLATPSSWSTNNGGIELGHTGSPFLIGQNISALLHIGANYFFDGSYKYKLNGPAVDHYMLNGEYVWRNASSGTAGNVITWVDRMKIDSSGNVGFGISPAVKLHAYGAGGTTLGRFETSSSGVGSVDIKTQSGGGNYGGRITFTDVGASGVVSQMSSIANGGFTWDVNGSEKMRISSTGLLSLKSDGATNSSHVFGYNSGGGGRIDLNDSAGSSKAILDYYSTGNEVRLLGSGATSGMAIGPLDATPLKFIINGAEKMRLSSSGAVGIRTTNPIRGLHMADEEFVIERTSGLADNRKWNFYLADNTTAGSAQNLFFRLLNDAGSGGTTAFSLRYNAQIGVTTTNWGTGGTAIGVSSGLLTTSPSSRRYKENEVPLSIDTSKIYDLTVKEFDYKVDGRHSFGGIAEDVAQVLPQIVNYEKDANGVSVPESISENKLNWLLLVELKKLRQEFDAYKTAHP